MSVFEDELRAALNRTSQENGSNTPDFILATYLLGCLDAFNRAVNARDQWYGLRAESGRGVRVGSSRLLHREDWPI